MAIPKQALSMNHRGSERCVRCPLVPGAPNENPARRGRRQSEICSDHRCRQMSRVDSEERRRHPRVGSTSRCCAIESGNGRREAIDHDGAHDGHEFAIDRS